MQVSLEDVSVLKAFIYPEKIALVCIGSALSKKSFLSKFEIDVFSCIFRLWMRWGVFKQTGFDSFKHSISL